MLYNYILDQLTSIQFIVHIIIVSILQVLNYTCSSYDYFQSSIDAALQLSECQRNPAYFQLGSTEGSQAALTSGSGSNNPTYHNIDHAQQNPNREPMYEVIPSDTAGTSRAVRGAQILDISCNENPAYNHLGAHVGESFRADPASPMMVSDYSQNPAYGIHPKS